MLWETNGPLLCLSMRRPQGCIEAHLGWLGALTDHLQIQEGPLSRQSCSKQANKQANSPLLQVEYP